MFQCQYSALLVGLVQDCVALFSLNIVHIFVLKIKICKTFSVQLACTKIPRHIPPENIGNKPDSDSGVKSTKTYFSIEIYCKKCAENKVKYMNHNFFLQ